MGFDFSLTLDGLLFGIGIALVWLGAVVSASLVRSLSIAGGGGILMAVKLVSGYWRYRNRDARNIVNATMNTTIGGVLSIDTIMADQFVFDVWPNAYHVRRIWQGARACTPSDPVVKLQDGTEQDYHNTYDPIISRIAASCSNEGVVDLALGRPVVENRFVIALTYEKLKDRRMRHFRAMVILEEELRSFPCRVEPTFRRPEHATRYATLCEIARQYAEHPERFGVVSIWRPVAAAASPIASVAKAPQRAAAE